jgi:hypothetical protein
VALLETGAATVRASDSIAAQSLIRTMVAASSVADAVSLAAELVSVFVATAFDSNAFGSEITIRSYVDGASQCHFRSYRWL